MYSPNKSLLRGILFISPWLIGVIVFMLYPIACSLYYSFTDYDIISNPRWIGVENYRYLFVDDSTFYLSINNTLFFVLIALPITLVFSLLLAILLNNNMKGIGIFRTIYYIPSILPEVATAVIWLWLYNPQFGIINILLEEFGIIGPAWLGDPSWTKPALAFMGVWGCGATVMIFLAGLRNIPQELYEAAEMDGADGLRRFCHVTLPMLSPVIFFNLITGVIGTFQYFTMPYIMTGEGPLQSTTVYGLYLYENAFKFLKMGYASAQAWVMLLIVLIATLFIFKTANQWVYYSSSNNK